MYHWHDSNCITTLKHLYSKDRENKIWNYAAFINTYQPSIKAQSYSKLCQALSIHMSRLLCWEQFIAGHSPFIPFCDESPQYLTLHRQNQELYITISLEQVVESCTWLEDIIDHHTQVLMNTIIQPPVNVSRNLFGQMLSQFQKLFFLPN